MKILMAGDIVGSPGRRAFARVAAGLKQDEKADFIVANAENSAGGKGLTRALAEELFAAGADVLTLGDHAWDQKDLPAFMELERRILRPHNFPPGCPGRGFVSIATNFGAVTVVSLMGRTFMRPCDCPFRSMDSFLSREHDVGRIILVDFHAEATSEKIAMGRYLDGRVSIVAGTHTHVQTSDETVLPNGTAYITDLGMTGPKDSIIGRDTASVTAMLLTGMPAKFKIAQGDVALEGILADVDPTTGRCRSIRRMREFIE